MGSSLRILNDPNASGQQYCSNFKRLAFVYCILTLFMIYSAYSTYQEFNLADHQFALQMVVLASIHALSYILKAITLYPLGKYNDILSITNVQIFVAMLFSSLAFLLLLIRYGYEMIYFNNLRAKFNDYDDAIYVNAAASMRRQLIVLAFAFIIIIIFNGTLLSILSILYHNNIIN